MSHEDLRAQCFQCFIANEALRSSEDEMVQLRTEVQKLDQDVTKREKEIDVMREVKESLETRVASLKHLPPSVSEVAAPAYFEAEKLAHTKLAVVDDSLKHILAETDKVRKEIEANVRTTSVLEQSMESQLRYNEALSRAYKECMKRLKKERERIGTFTARKRLLEEQRQKGIQQEKRLRSAVNLRSDMKARAQNDLRDRDFDALRMRKDATFGRRVYLSEVEHARDQEMWMHELLMENRRLKLALAKVRERYGLPEQQPKDDSVDDPPPINKDGESAADVQSPGGTVRPVPIATPPRKSAPSGPRLSREAKMLNALREENLKLLQQMVSSVQLLQMQFASAPEHPKPSE